MIPRCPICAGFAGTSRTTAGKRLWCAAPGCTWSAVVMEDALIGRDMCAVGQYFSSEDRDTHGLHLKNDAQLGLMHDA